MSAGLGYKSSVRKRGIMMSLERGRITRLYCSRARWETRNCGAGADANVSGDGGQTGTSDRRRTQNGEGRRLTQ